MKYFIARLLCCTLLLTLALGHAALAAEPSKTLTTATSAELNTLYPLNMDPQNNVTTRLVYEGLVTYEDDEVKPLLAESWFFDEGGTKLTFVLRQGVTFHDGTPFNAEAVRANMEYYHSSQNHGSMKATTNIVGMEIADEHTITIEYSTPYFAYLNDFCYPEVLVMVSPEVIDPENFQTMKGVVGTGPYIYEELVQGQYTRFARNEGYWGDAPHYDEVIVKYIHEASSRLQALRNGEVDMLFGNVLISYDDYEQAITLPGIQGLVADTNSETRNIVVNAASESLGDISVREAIAYAIDKEAIASGLTYGHEEAANALFDPSIAYGGDVELHTQRSYDPERANALLDEAGWALNESTGIREKDGTPLSLRFVYDSGEVLNASIAIAIKSQLGAVGIDVQTSGMDMYAWWMTAVEGAYELMIWNTEQPYTAPHNYFTPMPHSSPHTPALNALPNSEEFLAHIEAFQQSDDPEEIAGIFDYLINYSNDNVLDIPLTYIKDVILFNESVIEGYDFGSTPMFFDIDYLVAK